MCEGHCTGENAGRIGVFLSGLYHQEDLQLVLWQALDLSKKKLFLFLLIMKRHLQLPCIKVASVSRKNDLELRLNYFIIINTGRKCSGNGQEKSAEMDGQELRKTCL